MDKIARYRQIIMETLRRFAAYPSLRAPDVEMEDQLIFDTERDHYQILSIGWEKSRRVYFPVFHLDIKNGKIWVQEDATDFDIVGELEKQGVAKMDIVLAFHAPYKRPFTEYAMA